MSDEQGETSGLPNELEMLKRRADMLGIAYSNNIGVDTLRARVAAKMEGAPEAEEQVEDAVEEVEELAEEAPQPAQPNGFEAAAAVAAAKDTTTIAELQQQRAQQTAPATAEPTADLASILASLGLTPELLAQAKALADGKIKIAEPNAAAGVSATKVKKTTLRQYLHNEQMKLVRLRITCMDPKKKDLEGEFITVANKHLGTVKKFVPFGSATEKGWHVPYIIYKALQRRKFVNIRVTKDKRTGREIVHRDYAKEFALEVLPPLTPEELSQLGTAQLAAGSIDE